MRDLDKTNNVKLLPPGAQQAAEESRRLIAGELPDAGAVQVVMNREFLTEFRRWLWHRQMELFVIPVRDDLDTYGIRSR